MEKSQVFLQQLVAQANPPIPPIADPLVPGLGNPGAPQPVGDPSPPLDPGQPVPRREPPHTPVPPADLPQPPIVT